MATNYSRPLQSPNELNTTTSPTAPPARLPPARSKTNSFNCLWRRKARIEASQDEPQPERHSRSQGESQAGHIRSRRSTPATAQEEQRSLAKAKAKAYKDEKQARKAEEKARTQIIGGVAWGFDPAAGARSSNEESSDGGCFVSDRMSDPKQETEYEIDHLGRHTGRRWSKLGTWGIEHGGPGREGKFAHGSLKGKKPEISYSSISECLYALWNLEGRC